MFWTWWHLNTRDSLQGAVGSLQWVGTPHHLRRGPLLVIGSLVVLLALVVWVPKLIRRPARPAPAPMVPMAAQAAQTLALDYEKVQATTDNIFRYHLRLTPDRMLSVRIDDVANDRHVRKEKQLDEAYLRGFARTIRDAGFFSLVGEYQGIQPDVLDAWDLEITIGRVSRRVRVINRVEPEVFRTVREKIEECGKNELGLWAIQFSAEKLLQLAQDAFLLGRKLYDEREVQYGNLSAAIKAYDEADWYLETVEPKPDYYADMLAGRGDARKELQAQFDNQNFRAERAIRLRDWSQAAQELRVLCEIIPERSDERHQDARRKLLDVESRLKTQR